MNNATNCKHTQKINMLKVCTYLAIKLAPWRAVLLGLMCTFIVTVAYILLSERTSSTDPLLVISVVGILWLLLANVFIQLFSHIDIHAMNTLTGSLMNKLKTRIKRAFYHSFAILMLLMTFAALFISYRSIKVIGLFS